MEPNEINQTNNTKKVSIASLMPKPFIEYIKEEPDDTETSINDEPQSENQLLESEDMYQPPEYEHLYQPPGSEDINQPPESAQQPKIKNFPMPVRIKTERKSPSPTMEMIPFKKIKLEKQSNSQAETAESLISTDKEGEKEKRLQANGDNTNLERKRTRGGKRAQLAKQIKNFQDLIDTCTTQEERTTYSLLMAKAKNNLNRLRKKKKIIE